MSSYRSYVPWNKSGLSSSYSGRSSSGSRTYGTGKVYDSGKSSSTSQYDGGGGGIGGGAGGGSGNGGGGSGRRLGTGGDASTTSRNNYSSGFSYRSPYLGPNYSRSSTGSYLNSSKDTVTRSATTSSSSGATDRRDKENERLSLRDRYSSGTYPGRSRDSSYSSKDKDDADTGSSHRALGRSVTAKLSRDASPEKTLTSAEVGVKADRVGYSSSVSPYRLYTRTYSRSSSRDLAPDVSSSTTSTTAATPGHTTSSLRYGCSSRYGSNIIRSPVSEKPPTVFGLSSLGYSRRSISRSNSQQDSEEPKKIEEKPVSIVATTSSQVDADSQDAKRLENKGENEKTEEEGEEVSLTTFITIVTRGTSPTPPSTTSYVRTRRTDLARVIEKTIEKRKRRPEMLDKGIQSDPGENTARLSRYGVSSRWSAYLDRYPGAASSYSPVSRYTSRYSNSSLRSDEKETTAKSSADQETRDVTSTSEAPKTISSQVIVNNDVAKGTSLPGRKLNSIPLASSERKADSDISSMKQSKIVGDKSNETCLKVTKCVAGNEIPSDVSMIGHDESKQTACAKTRTVSGEEERKSAEFLKENKGMTKETEVECVTRGQIVKNMSAKYSVQNTGSMPKSSMTTSTLGSSSITPGDGTESQVSSDSKIEGVGSAQVPFVTSSNMNLPAVTDIRQVDEVIGGIKSRNASSVTLSLEDVSDKTSSCEENKVTSDTAVGSSNITKVIPFKNTNVKSSSQIFTAVPLGMKSKSSSATSLSSEEGSIKTSLVETSTSNTASERGTEVLGLVKKKPLKSVRTKHSEPPHTDGVACTISNSSSSAFPFSEAPSDKTSLCEGILGGTPNEDGSRTNTSCKQASISTSISNEESLTKTSLSPTLCSKTLPDAPIIKLPPPVPKSDGNTQGLKPSSSLHSLNKFGVANKDFRKSSLNVELSDNVQAEAFKKMQEKQRHASTFERKINRSNSATSGDSETASADAASTLSTPIGENDTSQTLGTSRSPFRLHFSSSTSKLPSGTTDSNIAVPKPQGSDRTKATPNLIKACCEPLRDTKGVMRLDTRDSGTDVSSTETSSSSGSSCSDEEDEGLIIRSHNSTKLEHRNRKSPTGRDSQEISATSATKNSKCDELSVSVDKLPRPPVSPKSSKTNESKSFFMRALAPVANLFKGKPESNKSLGLQRTGSTQSMSNSEHEGVEVKKMGALDEHTLQVSGFDRKRETETGSEINDENDSIKFSLKYKVRKQESGERAWWMDSNPNIPEGIKRIESNTSIKEQKDSEADSGTAVGVQKVCSNVSVNILQEENSSNIESAKKIRYKVCKDTCEQFEELPGLNKKSDEIIEGVNRIISNTSVNKIEGDEKVEVNTDCSEGAQKKSGYMSSQKNKNSEIDTARNHEVAEKNVGKIYRLRHQQSGELPWWLESSAPIPEGVTRIQSNASINKLTGCEIEERSCDSNYTDKSDGLQKTPSNMSLNNCRKSHYDTAKPSVEEEKSKTKLHRLRHQQSGELPWWLDNSAPVPEGVLRIQSNSSVNKLQDSEGERSAEGVHRTTSNASINKPRESGGESKTAGVQRMRSNSSVNKLQSSDSDSKKSGEGETVKKKIHKIRHQESGELPCWLSKSTSKSDGIQRISSSQSVNRMQVTEHKEEETNYRSFPYKLRHQESGEKAWWLSSRGDIPEGIERLDSNQTLSEDLKSGEGKQEREESSPTDTSEEDFNESIQEKENMSGNLVPKFPLVLPATSLPGRTLQPKEENGRRSPYDNLQEPEKKAVKNQSSKPRPKNLPLFIGSHTNIDDILGTAATLVNPVMGLSRLRKKLEGRDAGSSNEEESGADSSDCEEIDPGQVRIHDSTAKTPHIQRIGNVTDEKGRCPSGMIKLDDTALQLYKDGDYGSYLDLEASINEQQEEFDGFQTNRKNSIVLRTQLSVRVHTIIEKLLNSEGRELRRALFSLKQIFQEDKDLVHEFVQNDGLACLIKVGSEADQNYQNYILRALGQVMLYVDGMNGVMEHNETVQWLYALIASKFRLVVKTALKLLLVFIEYVETNCLFLIKAVHAVDTAHGLLPWNNIVKLLKDYDAADTELLIYAMTLANKTLNGIPDQDTYYDQVDALEEQGIEGTIQRYMSKQGTDLDLLRQFQIYEAVLHHEDGEEKGTPLKQLDETVRKTLRNRKSLSESVTTERRKSRRHSTGTSPMSSSLGCSGRLNRSILQTSTVADDEESESSSSRSSPVPEINGSYKESKAGDAGVTPALRRRRERAERQRSFIREQQETAATLKATLGSPDERVADENQRLCKRLGNGTLDNGDIYSSNKLQQVNRTASRKDLTPLMNAVNKLQDATSGAETPEGNGILKKPWVLSMMYGKNSPEEVCEDTTLVDEYEQDDSAATSERKKILQLKRENTVKDLTQKLSSQNIIHSPVEDGNNKNINRIGDMTGLISKAKEGLAKSKSKQDVVKSPTSENVPKLVEAKKSETELHWEELVHCMKRPLSLCDLDFTDLRSDDEVDILSPANISNGVPPPPPPVPMVPGMPSPRGGTAPPPPPPATRFGTVAPPPMPPSVISPPLFGVSLRSQRSGPSNTSSTDATKTTPSTPVKKTKKTVKLFWKEVRDDPIILAKLQQTGMIWDELNPVSVDIQKLEHLFESRAKDIITKKQQEMNKNKEIIVLDHKRSNAINIGMTKLPPPRSIKTAILKMDATIMNREGIEKLLTMLPTEEERSKIQEAQVANPDMPLGSAEQFLLTLASITELPARLKLWAFKLDFENSEKEIAEPLMDLKQGMETLKTNKTFRGILSTLLSIGIFLNGSEVKGFQIEYLAKVPEVKDTVHKHSLLHHLCHIVMEKFPDSSDLYSEIGAVTRASKVDFDELSANILKMEQECKASWDHLKVIAKHDGSTMKVKMSDFLADCAERIIVLSIVHRRVMNRFHKFLLWLGIPLHRVADTKPNEFCRIVSEFSLEYRTTRERVLQQLEKKANHRERNKTRGKMITEVGKFRTKEDRADAELRQLLGSDLSDAESIHGTLPWRRQRKDLGRTVLSPLAREEMVNGNLTDGDDEILESLVKTATKAPATRTTPRERKRTRHADRKSLKRSRTRENNLVEGGRESP